MNNNLKALLKQHAIDYTQVPSSCVSNDFGSIIAIENYYPKNDEGLKLSIALSIGSTQWGSKCWLSIKINNTNDASKPQYHPSYNKFEHNGITYYPYSINTSSYGMLDVLDLCNGLYRFVKEENIQK